MPDMRGVSGYERNEIFISHICTMSPLLPLSVVLGRVLGELALAAWKAIISDLSMVVILK
jgi:hypothetical protein